MFSFPYLSFCTPLTHTHTHSYFFLWALTGQHYTLQSTAPMMEIWGKRQESFQQTCRSPVHTGRWQALSLGHKSCFTYIPRSSSLSILPHAGAGPCSHDEVFHKAPWQVRVLVCAEWGIFEFPRRLSSTSLGLQTIKFTKARSELISKYILIHADLFSSWGLFISHCRFNIGLPSVITKDSMVGHNYIMQMTFAVLFELLASDVSFLYHAPHTSVSPQWLCKLPLSWSPSSWCCLSWLSHRHGPLCGCCRCDACLWHRLCWQLVGTGVHWFYHQMATHIWLPPNSQAWKTCSLHISLEIDWLFFDTAHCDCL